MKVKQWSATTMEEYEVEIPVEKVMADIDALFPHGMALDSAIQVVDALAEHINRKRTLCMMWAFRQPFMYGRDGR